MKKIFTYSVILLGLFFSTSCDDLLEEKSYDFIGEDQVPQTEKGAEMWVNGALNVLHETFNTEYFSEAMEYDSDHATGADFDMAKVGVGNFLAIDNGTHMVWNSMYTLIHRCNVAISHIEVMPIDEEVKKNCLGQVYFLKGWAYFILVRAYGPLPIFKKSVSDGESFQLPRSSVKEVYDYIIENLVLAETTLYTTKHSKYKLGRISKGAASTLLAKVYLTMASGAAPAGTKIRVMGGPAFETIDGVTRRKDKPLSITHSKMVVAGHEEMDSKVYFALARDKAKEVMDSQEFDLFPTHLEVWKVANRNKLEHIWSLQAKNGEEYSNGFVYKIIGTLNDNDAIYQGARVGLREHWYELFEERDLRIFDGVVHRWRLDGGNFPDWYVFYPAKDRPIVESADNSPWALIKREKYGWQFGDVSYSHFQGLCKPSKFEAVTDRRVIKMDFHTPFLRFAEVLLIFAEATNEVEGRPTSDAYDAVDRLMVRNGLDPLFRDMDQITFRSFILEERGKEFSYELNRRWDLIRWGIYLPVMNAIDIDEQGNVKRRQEKHLLFPIPPSEMNANKMITGNNPGW